MIKKIFASLLVFTLILTPVGHYVFQDDVSTVEAKRYKSGKKNYNTNQPSQFNNQKDEKKDNATTAKKSNQTKPANKGGFFSGGLMRGLFVGGLAGLLFGSLFANMGVLGSILGFLVNMAAIVLIVVVIRKIFTYFKEKKEKEKMNPWQS